MRFDVIVTGTYLIWVGDTPSNRVVMVRELFLNYLPIKSPTGTAEHRQECKPLYKW